MRMHALVAESARHSRQQSQRHTRRCAAVALGEIIAAEQRAVHRGGATVRAAACGSVLLLV